MIKRISKLSGKSVDIDGLRLIEEETPFAIREAYKALYSNILYLNIEDKCKKIAITSAMPGEAKTTVSTNLAITFSQNQEDKKILLIDTDMRKPKVAELLEISNDTHGLSEYLAGIDNEPNVHYIEKYRLSVLTSGSRGVNPTKLLGSSKMSELIKELEKEYDYIIIDTPPVTVVTDAVLLQGNVNGYIISTKADYSNINALEECISTLNRVGAEVFGVVLSSVKQKNAGKNYHKYSY